MAKNKTSEALQKLMTMQASHATVLDLDVQGQVVGEREVEIDQLVQGHVVKVRLPVPCSHAPTHTIIPP
jgi:Cu+-exporting ATPase